MAEHHVSEATLHNCPVHESGVVEIDEPVLLGMQRMRVAGFSLDLEHRRYAFITFWDAEPIVLPWGAVLERWP